MRNVGREPEAMEENRKNTAMYYFMSCEYGQQYLTEKDIHQLFMELDAIASLWPGMGSPQHIQRHIQLRDKYHVLWEQKWKDKLALNFLTHD